MVELFQCTWTMPPGRPPRSSSRLSDFSQSAATICIRVSLALICCSWQGNNLLKRSHILQEFLTRIHRNKMSEKLVSLQYRIYSMMVTSQAFGVRIEFTSKCKTKHTLIPEISTHTTSNRRTSDGNSCYFESKTAQCNFWVSCMRRFFTGHF